MPKLRSYVLILEEDDELRHALANLFQGEGFEVKEEADGREAVELVLDKEPSIILMADEILPLGDVELLPLLRRLTEGLIIVMGDGSEVSMVTSLLQGADLYMRKPINHRELLVRTRSLIKRAGLDRSNLTFADKYEAILRTAMGLFAGRPGEPGHLATAGYMA